MQVTLAVGIRFIGWVATSIKAAQRGHGQDACHILSTCLPTALIPLFGLYFGSDFYIYYRPLLLSISNGFQFYQVGVYYGHLYPCPGDCSEASVSVARSLVAVVSGNGAMFLVLTTLMASLTFKWLFISQYFFFMVLILSNRRICAASLPLRKAYSGLHSILAGQGYFLLPTVHSSLHQCVLWQLILQLIFGLWLPCWVAYSRELGARRVFLQERHHEASYPSKWDVLLYVMPGMVFPWLSVALSEMNLKSVD